MSLFGNEASSALRKQWRELAQSTNDQRVPGLYVLRGEAGCWGAPIHMTANLACIFATLKEKLGADEAKKMIDAAWVAQADIAKLIELIKNEKPEKAGEKKQSSSGDTDSINKSISEIFNL